MRTLVVDVTYRCNSPCRYCQWGSPELRKPDRPALDVCVPPATLAALGVEKVVFSGGEPALHPALDQILGHYARHVAERVVITNGLLMDDEMRTHLLSAGATAFTFSVDSVDASRFEANRGLPPKSLGQILGNLRDAANERQFGLGLNAVVTTATAAVASVRDLLAFAAYLRLDFVRFLPVFDDGYVSRNAPHLRLGSADSRALDEIASLVAGRSFLPTNTPGFWRDVARGSAARRCMRARGRNGASRALLLGQ